MKNRILALTAALGLVAGSALAVPYASQIRVSTTFAPLGEDLTISYIINEQADTLDVLIEVIDTTDGDAVIASFPGTDDWGYNEVVWDLSPANDGVDPIDEEMEGLRVRITVDAEKPEGWAWYALNKSPSQDDNFWNEAPLDAVNHNNLFDDAPVRAHSVHVPWDQDLDDFGFVLLGTSNSGDHGGVLPLTADMRPQVQSQDGGRDTLVLNSQGSLTFQDAWYITPDPLNPGHYYVSGQPGGSGAHDVWYGTLNDAQGAIVLEPTVSPRSIAVRADGSDRILYLAHGNSSLSRVDLDSNNVADPNELVNLLDISETLYSKHVMLDADGNLYWLARQGQVYRWPASVVATADTAGSLTEANADWDLDLTAFDLMHSGRIMELAEMPNGDIVVSTSAGLVNLGARDQTTPHVASYDENDVFFDYEGDAPVISHYASGLYADAFGNLFFTDGAQGTNLVVGAASPGGDTLTTVTAPTSQTFEIGLEPTRALQGWNLYQ